MSNTRKWAYSFFQDQQSVKDLFVDESFYMIKNQIEGKRKRRTNFMRKNNFVHSLFEKVLQFVYCVDCTFIK